jgi:hypothetical protein
LREKIMGKRGERGGREKKDYNTLAPGNIATNQIKLYLTQVPNKQV